MTADELKPILESHRAWREGTPGYHRADLSGVDLYGANLRGADLREVDLREANLCEANLYEADLRGVNFRGADLSRAYFHKANLYGANFRGANLRLANFRGANLYGANFSEAGLRGATGLPAIKPVAGFRAALLTAVQQDGCRLDMGDWHTCDTTHSLAGWVVTVHPEGKLLESIYTTTTAAALILLACGERVPDLYDDQDGADDRAMNWLRTGEQKGAK